MNIRYSTAFFAFTLVTGLLFGLLMLHAANSKEMAAPEFSEIGKMVKDLQLTDLCLFTEARYTRHPAMADMNAPFQEHPASFEHFPSGSLLLPQRQSKRIHAESH
jgi:hypothetical protein